MDVERTRDGVFLKKGWQGFVSHHNLIVGEFIVFKYDGSYSFIVKIYGINGCKRELFAAKRVKVEQEIEAEQSLGNRHSVGYLTLLTFCSTLFIRKQIHILTCRFKRTK